VGNHQKSYPQGVDKSVDKCFLQNKISPGIDFFRVFGTIFGLWKKSENLVIFSCMPGKYGEFSKESCKILQKTFPHTT